MAKRPSVYGRKKRQKEIARQKKREEKQHRMQKDKQVVPEKERG